MQFQGRLADKVVQIKKLEKQQEDRPRVVCEGQQLGNAFETRYLRTIFTANASQDFDVDSRIAMYMSRYGRLRTIFDSKVIALGLKLRLYEAAVCSLMTHGCETWDINEKTRGRINEANSVMLARITGNSISHEARPATTSLEVIRRIRMRSHRLGSKIQYWIINWIIFFVKLQWIFGGSQVKRGWKGVKYTVGFLLDLTGFLKSKNPVDFW